MILMCILEMMLLRSLYMILSGHLRIAWILRIKSSVTTSGRRILSPIGKGVSICRPNRGYSFFPTMMLCLIMPKVLRSNPEFTSDRSFANTVLSDYFSGKISSAACERVFHRGLLAEGMVHFPLAWCSDVATWYKISEQAGSIVNISGAPVLWRNAEGNNISSSKGLDRQKASALTMFIAWLKENYHGNEDMRLKKSLYSFIKTNLRVSFSGNYTNADLYGITKAYGRFDLLRAAVLYLKCLKFCK